MKSGRYRIKFYNSMDRDEFAYIYAALDKALPDALGKNMELEARLGTVIDKATNARLAIEAMHPCVINRSNNLRFSAEVSESDFSLLSKYFGTKTEKQEKKRIVDTLLKGYRQSQVKEIDGKQVSETPLLIQKRKMKTVDIFCPENKYDLRLSLSEELVKKDTTLGMTGNYAVRNKLRNTYEHEAYVVDMTQVTTEKDSSRIYEVELEAKNEKYNRDEFIGIIVQLLKDTEREAMAKRAAINEEEKKKERLPE